ncbi:MAG: HEPN domain-containing protein [Planctomycetota bacterium]
MPAGGREIPLNRFWPLLVWIEIEFPKTHDLEVLLNLIEPTYGAVVSQLQDIITLTPYGVELRYPGDRPDASPEEAHDAVQLAQRVRDAVMPLLPDTSTRDEN